MPVRHGVQLTPRPGQKMCRKICNLQRRTYTKKDLAIQEAKRHYDDTGEKMFVHQCYDFPCAHYRHLHWTSQIPTRTKDKKFNEKLINYYTEKEQHGKGLKLSRARYEAERKRKKRIRLQVPYLTWDDDGGALHPRELED